jgi:hypothetical protein
MTDATASTPIAQPNSLTPAAISRAADSPSRAAGTHNIVHILMSAAWMSILLGITVECAVLAIRLAAGSAPSLSQSFVEFAGSVSWSTVVCSGIAIGTAAARQRDRVMGVLGFVSAPFGWAAAKGLQRGTQWMLGVPVDSVGLLVVQVGALKTVEYCLLGYLVGRMLLGGRSTLVRHACLGLAAGVVFGLSIVAVNIVHAPQHHLARAKLLGLVINELLFPIGCSMVLYFVGRLSDRNAVADSAVDLAS